MFKASITVSLALIIEASLEAYFQFWLQSNYSLPDILKLFLAKDFDLEQLVTFRTVSILLSFITITVSIVKIRFIIWFYCPIYNSLFNLATRIKMRLWPLLTSWSWCWRCWWILCPEFSSSSSSWLSTTKDNSPLWELWPLSTPWLASWPSSILSSMRGETSVLSSTGLVSVTF